MTLCWIAGCRISWILQPPHIALIKCCVLPRLTLPVSANCIALQFVALGHLVNSLWAIVSHTCGSNNDASNLPDILNYSFSILRIKFCSLNTSANRLWNRQIPRLPLFPLLYNLNAVGGEMCICSPFNGEDGPMPPFEQLYHLKVLIRVRWLPPTSHITVIVLELMTHPSPTNALKKVGLPGALCKLSNATLFKDFTVTSILNHIISLLALAPTSAVGQ